MEYPDPAPASPSPQADPAPPLDVWKRWPRWWRWPLATVLLASYGCLHLFLADSLIKQTNFTDKDLLGADQKHNLKFTLQTRPDLSPDVSQGISEPLKKWLPHRTDGVINPLWPWVAAWLAEPTHAISGPSEVTEQDRRLFNRGRWFNVGLTCGFVILIGIGLIRVYSLPAMLNAVLLMGLGAFLPRAVFYQPEPLYYVFFTLTWIACLFALLRNSLWIYALVGLFSGLAYLAKGSVQPLLLVFIGVSTLRWFWGWILSHWPGKTGTSLWIRRNHWFGLALLLFVHLMTCGPRLSHAYERFGDPFHSYPGYWMWFDDFEDCYAWMNQYPNRAALATLPKADRPSFANYAKTHSNQQMLERLTHGVQVKLADLLAPPVTQQSKKKPKPWKGLLEHRGWYLTGLFTIALGVLAASIGVGKKLPDRALLHPESASVVLFVVGALCAYTLAYGWYTPIGRGDRFMLSLYAPLVLSLLWAAESILRRARRRKAPRPLFIAYYSAQWLLFGCLAWRLLEIWQHPVFKN